MTLARSVVFGLSLVVLAGCSSGYLPFSGGALQGTERPSPSSWASVAEYDIVQLETRPNDPYSVNIWAVVAADELYVFAGANHATWIEHMEANPRVRLQLGESVYVLTSTRVTDPEEFERFAQQWELKYGNRPRNENVAETYLMRLRALDG